MMGVCSWNFKYQARHEVKTLVVSSAGSAGYLRKVWGSGYEDVHKYLLECWTTKHRTLGNISISGMALLGLLYDLSSAAKWEVG